MITNNEWDAIYTQGAQNGYKKALSDIWSTASNMGVELTNSDVKYISLNMLKSIIDLSTLEGTNEK